MVRLILFVILGLCFGCATTDPVASDKLDKMDINYNSLADYLRQNTNVQISGEGALTRLQIRGINSIKGDTRPFLYVDKIPVGRDYNRANNAVNPNQIERVEVITSLSKLSIYGEDGNCGVIKIHTKTNMTK